MQVKIEMDLKDDAQMDVLCDLLKLLKDRGFHCRGTDTLKKVEPGESTEEKGK